MDRQITQRYFRGQQGEWVTVLLEDGIVSRLELEDGVSDQPLIFTVTEKIIQHELPAGYLELFPRNSHKAFVLRSGDATIEFVQKFSQQDPHSTTVDFMEVRRFVSGVANTDVVVEFSDDQLVRAVLQQDGVRSPLTFEPGGTATLPRGTVDCFLREAQGGMQVKVVDTEEPPNRAFMEIFDFPLRTHRCNNLEGFEEVSPRDLPAEVVG